MRVLGRVSELETLAAFLDGLTDPESLPRVALITGEPGIGKTVLWDEMRERARAGGFVVLPARPVEPESALGFAGLADLFDTLPAEVLDALPGPQRHALNVALLREHPGDAPADPRSVATATLGALRSVCATQPVLLAVDDLSWLDAATRRVLAFVLRRLGPEPIGLLATVRTDRGTLPHLPTDNVPAERLLQITPQSLSIGAIREIVADHLDFAPSHRLVVRVHEASQGNPYFALELARALAGQSEARAGDELPVPNTLRRLLHGRVARMPVGVRDVLLCAALAPGAPRDTIVAAAGDPSTARSQLAVAVRAGIIETHPEVVAFGHPLLRSVVIEDATAEQVRTVHARLAQTLAGPMVRTRHRALAAEGPDEGVARALDDAASEAHLRGATDTAADLGELALTMTPPGEQAAARRRTLAAAAFRFESGDPVRARVMLADLVAAEAPGPQRSPQLVQLAKYQRYSGEPLSIWSDTLTAALAEADEHDLALRTAIHVGLGMAASNGGDVASIPAHVAALADLADRLDDSLLDAQVAASIAFVRFLAGEGVHAGLVEKALTSDRGAGRVATEESPTYTIAVILAHADDPQRARELLERDIADANARGDEISLPILLWLLVLIETWAGNWDAADRHATQGLRAAELADNPFGIALVVGARAVLRASHGAVDDARDDATRAETTATQVGLVLPILLAAEALGLLALAHGDAATAHAAMAEHAERAVQAGVVELGAQRILPLEVEALVRLRQLEAARDLMSAYASRPERSEHSSAAVAEHRCRGLLLAANGELAAAEEALSVAVAIAEKLEMPFEHARTLLIAGEIHRRARHRRRAQERVTEAQGIFDELGCALWSARCGDELARVSGKPLAAVGQAADGLTATEQRVAELAAEGLTTREIAGTLFTGVRTVEAHLHHVYRKLGVRSRVELSRQLGERGATT